MVSDLWPRLSGFKVLSYGISSFSIQHEWVTRCIPGFSLPYFFHASHHSFQFYPSPLRSDSYSFIYDVLKLCSFPFLTCRAARLSFPDSSVCRRREEGGGMALRPLRNVRALVFVTVFLVLHCTHTISGCWMFLVTGFWGIP